MFCMRCGAKLEDDAIFCVECGARQDVDIDLGAQPQGKGSDTSARKSASTGSGNALKITLIVVCAVLAVILVVLCAVVLPDVLNKDSEGKGPDKEDEVGISDSEDDSDEMSIEALASTGTVEDV